MRMQVNTNGQPIDVRPQYLLAPAALETDAAKALAAIYPPSTDAVNPFTGFVGSVIDPRLDHAGQVKPYWFADTAIYPTLAFVPFGLRRAARLPAWASPEARTSTEPRSCRWIMAAAVIGWQGMLKIQVHKMPIIKRTMTLRRQTWARSIKS